MECYYIWDTSGDDQKKIYESPPSGFCSIVFNSGSPYYLDNSKYERLRVPEQFIAGQAIYSYKLFVSDPVMISGIVFKPAALNTLYGIPVYEYTEERIPLSKVFRAEFLAPYIMDIANGTPEERARLLEHF
ncbi:MAG: AraC family transcriptional regulator, partial [Chitinophagaceae bacterium]|nr:AraC family transcriptional regulator [Chitinophagaceae bacterium]